jgi:hypothetical protein
MNRTVRIAATMVAFALVGSSAAYAQATRTWVSGVGDDANPCSRTAPCKTFAGAISKTAPGGEISVLDPGGFGGVTITKSITINGEGTLAGILVGAGTTGVIVNAAAADVVTLRNISIHGVGAANGIRFLGGGTLIVDRVDISGAGTTGIDVESSSANAKVVISNTTIRGGTNGIQVTNPGGGVNVAVDRTSIRNATTGIDAQAGSVNVTNSVFTGMTGFAITGTAGNHTVHGSLFTGNFAAAQAQAAATVSLSDNNIVGNGFAFGCSGGGTLASTGDNRVVNNTSNGCSPNGVVVVQ